MTINIFIAGHNGMVGSAIKNELDAPMYNLICANRRELDLLDKQAVLEFFRANDIDQVYLAAAKVGGIQANNSFPADFIYENLMIQNNIIHAAHLCDVEKLLFLGSSCIYPKICPQPISESSLLTGTLELTNEPYAIAKISGIKLCESYNRQYGRDYRSIMPTNLYGPNDNFHLENSHVIPAMVRRFHKAVKNNDTEVVIWGSGNPMREFLHVSDLASAARFVMELDKSSYKSVTRPHLSHINVGTGKDCSIKSLAELIAKVTGFSGNLKFDRSKPDGTPRKLLDVSKINSLGWTSKIELCEGLVDTYRWFNENFGFARL